MTTFEPGARLALTQGLVSSPCSTAFLARSPAATITDGFEVLVQLVIAAITTEPLRDRRDGALDDRLGDRRRGCRSVAPSTTGNEAPARLLLGGPGGLELLERRGERRLGVVQRHPVLRPPRAGQAGLDGREVELERVGIRGLGRPGAVEHPLGLGVRLDQADRLGRPAGELEVPDRLGVDREQPAGRAVLGGHVGDRGPVGQRQARQAVAVVLDELADDALLPQHLGDGQHQVGGGRPFAEGAGELEADDLGDQHRDRLAQHGGLGLDAADAPAQHAQPVDHRRVRVGADQRVGIRQVDRRPPRRRRPRGPGIRG